MAPAPTELEDALLWKISKKGMQHDSYLYGTIHIINSEDYFLPKGTLSAMDASSKMMFEIDMTEMSDPAKQMGMLNKAFMSDGKTLGDLLSDEDYAIVEAHFKDQGLPLFMLERIKPMFLSVFAMGGDGIDMGGLQDGSIKSYEMEFMEIAQQQDKPVGGLETIDYQISVFDSIPYDEQAKMLVEMIQESDSGSEQFDDMVKMYRSQDINTMAGSLQDEKSGMGDYEDILLRKRNENWIPVMGKEMAAQPTFFAVGAAHLGGRYGVIPLLRQAGYSLTPVSQVQ
jgi:uncharacterized protein YbaP (TraB family)